jgi:hypothetical protein
MPQACRKFLPLACYYLGGGSTMEDGHKLAKPWSDSRVESQAGARSPLTRCHVNHLQSAGDRQVRDTDKELPPNMSQ